MPCVAITRPVYFAYMYITIMYQQTNPLYPEYLFDERYLPHW